MDHFHIKEQSKQALIGNRLMLFVILVITAAVASLGSAALGIGFLLSIIIEAGIYLSIRQMLLNKKAISVEVALIGYFKDLEHCIKILVVGFLFHLLVVVGYFLLIIPGVYWALKYSQALFIMADHKEMDIFDAFKESAKIMEGKKMDLFIFYIGFIGHFLLGIITFGLYFLYFIPYLKTCIVNYYLYLTHAYKKSPDPEVIEAQF
ncbi:MAG: DUF975 family protein [Bacilli bacterium]